MNIGLFTDTYFPQINGIGTSVYNLSAELEKLGHKVYVFTPKDPKDSNGKHKDNVIRMPSVPAFFIKSFRIGLLYSPLTIARIKNLNLDIVHTQTEFSLGMFGKALSRMLGLPMVHTYHTMYEDYVHYIVNGHIITPLMAQEYSRFFCNTANAVIAPTVKARDSLVKYGVKKPISIIPTGINIKNFRKQNFSAGETAILKKELGINPTDPAVIFVGRLAIEKSIDVIIKAMPRLIEMLPDAKLIIVGDGPARRSLEALAEETGVLPSVIFTGARPWFEIGRYYQLGDVFVTASLSETQGLTFVEAAAGGLPVVAKLDECLSQFIEDGVNGVFFKEDFELPSKLYEMLTDTGKRERIAKAGTGMVERLSSEAFAGNVLSLYTDILENPEKYKIKPTPGIFLKDLAIRPVNKIIYVNRALTKSVVKRGARLKQRAINIRKK